MSKISVFKIFKSYQSLYSNVFLYFRGKCSQSPEKRAFGLGITPITGGKTCIIKSLDRKQHKTFCGESSISLNSLTTNKQKTKFSAANFQKMLSPSYIIFRIQSLEGKQCRAR